MFDRVILLNLARRPDRLDAFRQCQKENGWELPEVQVFPALDGHVIGVPASFTAGPGAYGCLRSWCSVLERALMDGILTLACFEDDATFDASCWSRLKDFMQSVPEWDMLMLGGQDRQPPLPVRPGVFRCINTVRTHAFAVKGAKSMRSLLKLWTTATTHIDNVMADQWQICHRVYKPEEWLFFQAATRSDITLKDEEKRTWNKPKVRGIYLETPPQVRQELEAYGFNSDGLDVVKLARHNPMLALSRWLEHAQDIPTIYPEIISFTRAKVVCPKLIHIKANTVEEVLSECRRHFSLG